MGSVCRSDYDLVTPLAGLKGGGLLIMIYHTTYE